MGSRWAIGFDKDKKAVGVYDLSYAMPWTRIKLASLTGRRVKAKDVIGFIRDGEIESSDKDLSENAIEELSRDPEQNVGVLPSDWREKVSWKNSEAGMRSNVFALSDFNIESVVKDAKVFQEEMDYAQSIIASSDELGFLDNFLSHISVSEADGAFELYFEPATKTSKPKKVADLKNPKLSFLKAMEFELVKKAVGKATGLIAEPIVRAFVKTAVDRLFHFVKLVNFSHDHMALEVLADLTDGEGLLPRDILQPEDLVHMAESLEFANSSLTNGWKWAFKKPYKEWLTDREDQAGYSESSAKWFADHSLNFQALNERFFVVNERDLALVTLSKANKKKGPFISHIEGKSSPHKNARLRTEIVTTAVVFGTKFIPLAGGLLADLFKRVVEKPVDKQKYWEARLIAHLEQRQDVKKEVWYTEMTSLEGQRLNPFFKSRAEIQKVIEIRKKELGI